MHHIGPSLILVAVLAMFARADAPAHDPQSPVHPRRFGFPGGVGPTRGWYYWERFVAAKSSATVRHEGTGEKFTVRVLPWATTYRYLVYGAHPDELREGERVNLFFAPDDKQKRGYLVHFQDELCQMKGHGHTWEVVRTGVATTFSARVMAGQKPLDDRIVEFHLHEACEHWRAGKKAERVSILTGQRFYMTWTQRDNKNVVHLTSDDASLDGLKTAAAKAVHDRLARDGLGAFVEAVDGELAQLLVFPTYWSQVGQWRPGQQVMLLPPGKAADGAGIMGKVHSRKNLGTYGSGATELKVQLQRRTDAEILQNWRDGQVVRVLLLEQQDTGHK